MKGLNQRPVLNHDAKVAAAVHTLAVLLLKPGQSNAIEWLRPLCDDQQSQDARSKFWLETQVKSF